MPFQKTRFKRTKQRKGHDIIKSDKSNLVFSFQQIIFYMKNQMQDVQTVFLKWKNKIKCFEIVYLNDYFCLALRSSFFCKLCGT